MATKKANTKNPITELKEKAVKLRSELQKIKLDIKAGVEKNTNAHKKLKKELAQTLTQITLNQK